MNLGQSTLLIKPGNYKSVIEIPYSKSYANRALAIASVQQGSFIIENIASSSDVETMIKVLRKVGVDIEKRGSSIIVKNSFPECEKKSDDVVKIFTGDGGTTNRILIGILCLGRNKYELISSEKFKDRPNEEAFNVFNQIGVDVDVSKAEDDFWIRFQGPIKTPKNLDVDCSKTTQFYTGFKVLELVHGIKVSPNNLKTSKKYVEITNSLIQSSRNGKSKIVIPVDFSSAAYPIVFASVSNEVLIKNCHFVDQLQADSCLIELIRKIGGKIELTSEGLKISPSNLQSFSFDCSGCPDLVPALVFLACNISGKSILKNIEVLRHKESDRIKEICKILDIVKINYLYNENSDELIIEGGDKTMEQVAFDLPGDHRMIFLAAMFLRSGFARGTVNNYHHIKKSYPEFLDHLQGE